MTVDCQILFDQNTHGTYFTGQVVTGKVHLNLDKPKNVKGVVLKICGYAKTEWTAAGRKRERRRGRRSRRHERREPTNFEGREDYLATTTYLVGSEDAIQVTLDPGTHTYAFSVTIPNMCPSSFEGTFGHIRYVAKVLLLRPWKFDQTYTVGFTVLKALDLNAESPTLKAPVKKEASETFGCWLWKSGPLTLTVELPQTGYVPGQFIRINAQVSNDTNVQLKGVRYALNLVAKYTTQTPQFRTQVERITLAKKTSDAVGEKSQKSFTEVIRVPATPPTLQQLCNIIQISYEIDVMAKPQGSRDGPSVVIPITIGNVPLLMPVQPPQGGSPPGGGSTSSEKHLQANGAGVESNAGSSAPAGPSTSSSSREPDTSDLPPPTYEEAMFATATTIDDDEDDDEEEHAMGTTQFAPRYPVYNVPEQTAQSEGSNPMGWNTKLEYITQIDSSKF